MERDTFYEKVGGFIRAQCAPPNAPVFDGSTDLIRNGVIDSFALTEIILYIEEITGRAVSIEHIGIAHVSSMEAMYTTFLTTPSARSAG